MADAKPCHVIAEIGVNHDGSLAKARELILAAKGAGADSVKFQHFTAEMLVSPDARKAEYQMAGDDSATQKEMLAKLQLSDAELLAIREICDETGIDFICTPFSIEAAGVLRDIGVAAIKVGSGDLTYSRFLEAIAEFGLPIILSTGMASLDEAEAAVARVAAVQARVDAKPSNFERLSVLHCTSAYPAPLSALNLKAIATLRHKLSLPVGYSDHSPGILVAPVAVALGATIVEKHITLNRSAAGPDHRASIEPEEFATMVNDIRQLESALGSGDKVPVGVESDTREVARRSLFLAKDVEQGCPISADDIIELRPGTGIPASDVYSVIGRSVTDNLAAGTMLSTEHLAPCDE